ncbi:miniconductance mechanosensitive channel MscM [Candidatus Schneideria nysicola]|nr:miniconductance mechanosensitive channel MscM [Candidatus Schneideria nysicola]
MIFLIGCFLSITPVFSNNISLDENKIKQDLQQVLKDTTLVHKSTLIDTLQLTLHFIAEGKSSYSKIKEYQKAIDNFPQLTNQLQDIQEKELDNSIDFSSNLSSNEINQQILQINNQLIQLTNQIQKEHDLSHSISDSLGSLPLQQTEARKALSNIEKQLHTISFIPTTRLEQAQLDQLKAEYTARKLKVEELDLAQLSANNRQELSRLRCALLKKQHDKIDRKLQLLRNHLNDKRQKEAEQAIEHTAMLVEKEGRTLPKSIDIQLKINRELSTALNKQSQYMDDIAYRQRKTTLQILQVRQALSSLKEQAKWLDESPALGETLRAQISKLPDIPKFQQLNSEMAELRVQRLQYEEMINKLQQFVVQEEENLSLTPIQKNIFDVQLITKRNLLNLLLTGCDTQILELTKLKVATSQLEEARKELQEAAHRYLFWVADISPITLSFLIDIGQDLRRLITLNTFHQLSRACLMIVTRQETLILIFSALLLIGFSISSRIHYYAFLERSSNRVGKVNQDHFFITLYTIFWSILMASPFPILWAVLGYSLQHHAWLYPIAAAIGDGISATVPILWIFMIIAYFAKNKGLFIAHFNWPVKQVKLVLRHYTLFTSMIIPLIMTLITLDNYSDREFRGTLGRLCFITLCICLALINKSLKRASIPFYLDKKDSFNNIINYLLWNLMIFAPILAIISACLGYLSTAQALLARLETSFFICFVLLIIYYVIRRWMFIQRRRIAFERAKQRRADILAQRARSEEELSQLQLNDAAAEVDEKILDLDIISAQSLQLVRSILTLIALLSVILLWSELHSAFLFLENITLWDVNSSIQGVDNIQPITLGAVLIAILVFIITTQMVRNLPALLELALLQHLDLTPGTGYAITTLTKYSLMLIGGLIGFSLIGVEWSKLQWLVAALGVGLGFGLQEIFANFISGLMILFEKPIRIGDTVTIRDLTGSITRISTRATSITDWDRKEIIVPNKAFITEQFVNWSLSDTVTRVVLRIPAPPGVNIEKITNILIQAAKCCPLVLETPPPEAYLVDLQQGLPLFEIRIYAAEMSHRVPLRHQVHTQILNSYRENGLELPFPPFQLRRNQIQFSTNKKTNFT